MHIDVVAVILAAGAGSRYTGPGHKLSAELPPSATEGLATVIERSIAHAVGAAIGPVIVVTGAVADIADHIAASSPADALIIRHTPRWALGQMTSLRVGIDAATELGARAVVVGLGDQPFVTPDAWRRVAGATGAIAVATYAGERGNPVLLDSSVWPLLPTEGDEGARSLMRVRPDLVREVPCTGSSADIDTEEDLRRWQNS